MTHINQRRDTAANWASENPVLQLGEVGWERDTKKAKLGDGSTAWNDLDYAIEFPDTSDFAELDSPTFIGTPSAPTQADGSNSTALATTAFVKNQNYAALDSPDFTGSPTAPTPSSGSDDTSIATTEFVKDQGYLPASSAASTYAPIANPVFTGDPKAPTPSTSDSDTTIATTAFVKAAIAANVTLLGVEIFDASGTFTKATYPTAKFVRVKVQAGGGSGGGAGTSAVGESSYGCGGSAGGVAEKLLLISALGTSETVTVGNGGAAAGNAQGNDGQNSSFGSLCVASKGLGGDRSTSTATESAIKGPNGGVGTVGDLLIRGGQGGQGLRVGPTAAIGGDGGSSPWLGGGGLGKVATNSPGSGAGTAAYANTGSGGGGGASSNGGTSNAGGAGAAGKVVVEIYG